jgi:hypothetical protein
MGKTNEGTKRANQIKPKGFQKKQNILKVHASSPIFGNQLICNMFG